MMRSDNQLIHAYLNGDETALRSLFERHLPAVYGFIYGFVRNDGDAADIAQDTFVSAWAHIKTFDQKKRFRTWLFAIAKNAALNWIKKKKPLSFSAFSADGTKATFLETFSDEAPLPDELTARGIARDSLSLVIKQLNPQYQTVLSLRYDNNYTFREIAETLGEPLHTVKSRHRRALLLLKKLIPR